MAEESTRLKKFLADQEEAVQLARSTPEGSDAARVDSVNVALSLAHANAQAADHVTTITELLANARAAHRYLSGND